MYPSSQVDRLKDQLGNEREREWEQERKRERERERHALVGLFTCSSRTIYMR